MATAVPRNPQRSGEGRTFRITGLDCAEEVALLKRAVGPRVGGDLHLTFDLLNGRMTVADAAAAVPDSEITAAIRGAGLQGVRWDTGSTDTGHRDQARRQGQVAGASGGFWLAGLIALVAGAPAWVSAGLFLAAVVAGVRYVGPKAIAAARHMRPDMNLLMVIAVAGAIALGEYLEAGTVAFLFALALALEGWSIGRARRAVAALLALAPPVARLVRTDGSEATVPAEEVAIGERFVVRAGDRIPLDGRVVEGRGSVDQSPITGESAACPKDAGDDVFAGTINIAGTLKIEATKAVGDTLLARITRSVGAAHARRAPVEQWVERFARIYTPAVMVLALALFLLPPLMLGGAWTDWLYNALVMLVIACPCALVISTPVSIVAALAAGARSGVLIKGGAFVELPARITTVALDKTGTMTSGRPRVSRVQALEGWTRDAVLAAAAALEARSPHPLAAAILAEAERTGGPVTPADGVEVVPGRGVTGRVDGRALWLGSARYAAERGLGAGLPGELLASVAEEGATVVILDDGSRVLGVLALADTVRPGAASAVADLRRAGVRRIVMLTGDNEGAAGAVARSVGVDEVRAGLLPEDKLVAIEALVEGREIVAMVGDGVNDAPAMARAHLGIAMGVAGTDAAIETADVALMSDDLSRLPWLIGHSRRTLAVIRQNVAFALGVKAVFAIAAALGMATMWGAIAADAGASLLVIVNALRLLGPSDGPARDRPAEPEPRPREAARPA